MNAMIVRSMAKDCSMVNYFTKKAYENSIEYCTDYEYDNETSIDYAFIALAHAYVRYVKIQQGVSKSNIDIIL